MINLGIIGAGRIGKVHALSITNFINNAKIVAMSDVIITPEITEFATKIGVNNLYDDYHKIINDPNIDAVLICSSTNTHAPISIEAAAAGKHIFCEKPIDADVTTIKKVLQAVDEAGVQFQVGFNRRFDHNFRAIKDHVDNGDVGAVQLIKISSRDPAPPPVEYVKVSGGMFFDMTIHDFDMVRYLSNSEVESVYASANVLVDPAIGEAGDIDTAIITLNLKNGAIAVIDNSRQAVYGYDQRAEVFGSKGAVKISNDTNSSAVLSNADGVISEKPKYFFLERYMQSFADEMKEFISALENKTKVPVSGIDGLKPVLIALAAKKSLELKRAVSISEIEQQF